MPNGRVVLLALVLLGFSGGQLGQVAMAEARSLLDEAGVPDVAELDLEALLGHVTAASGRRETLYQAPAAVTVLDEEDIRLSGAIALPELLRRVPGVQVMQLAPGNFAVALRGTGGLQGNNLVLTVDGVPLNSPVDGAIDWSLLPLQLSEIERVEIIRGPVSPIYGANAYTGVVAIQSRRLPAVPSTQATVNLEAGIDAAGQGALGIGSALEGRRDDVSWRLSGHGVLDDTFARIEGEAGSQPGLRRGALLGRAGWDISERSRLSLLASGSWSRASATDYLLLEPQPHQATSLFWGITFERQQVAPWMPSLSGWLRAQLIERDAAGPATPTFIYDDVKAWGATAGGDIALALPLGLEGKLGLEAGALAVEAPFLHETASGAARARYAATAQLQRDFGKMLIAQATLRGDYSAFVPDVTLSYRASLLYYRPSFSVRLSAGSAFRNPTFVELAGRFTEPAFGLVVLEGQPDLDPPRLDSIELGSVISLFGGKLALRPVAYIARAIDLVVHDFEPVVRNSFRNDRREVVFAGGELEMDWSPATYLEFEASLTALHFISDEDDPSATAGVPGHNARYAAALASRVALLRDRLDVGLGITFASERSYNVRAGIPPRLLPKHDVPPLARLDLTIDWRPWRELRLWLRARGTTHLPHDVAESPFPSRIPLGSRALLELRYSLP